MVGLAPQATAQGAAAAGQPRPAGAAAPNPLPGKPTVQLALHQPSASRAAAASAPPTGSGHQAGGTAPAPAAAAAPRPPAAGQAPGALHSFTQTQLQQLAGIVQNMTPEQQRVAFEKLRGNDQAVALLLGMQPQQQQQQSGLLPGAAAARLPPPQQQQPAMQRPPGMPALPAGMASAVAGRNTPPLPAAGADPGGDPAAKRMRLDGSDFAASLAAPGGATAGGNRPYGGLAGGAMPAGGMGPLPGGSMGPPMSTMAAARGDDGTGLLRPSLVPMNNTSAAAAAAAAVRARYADPSLTPAQRRAMIEDDKKLLPHRGLLQAMRGCGLDADFTLDADTEAALGDLVDWFIANAVSMGCAVAKNRRSTMLTARDIAVYLERVWNLHMPGYGGDAVRPYRRPSGSELHKQRAAAVRRTAANLDAGAGGGGGNAPTGGGAGQAGGGGGGGAAQQKQPQAPPQ